MADEGALGIGGIEKLVCVFGFCSAGAGGNGFVAIAANGDAVDLKDEKGDAVEENDEKDCNI